MARVLCAVVRVQHAMVFVVVVVVIVVAAVVAIGMFSPVYILTTILGALRAIDCTHSPLGGTHALRWLDSGSTHLLNLRSGVRVSGQVVDQ